MAGPVPNFDALTGGRGLRQNANLIDQRESFAVREKLAATRLGWFATALPSPTAALTAAAGVATAWTLAPVLNLDEDTTVTRARLNVTNASAGSSIWAGIYQLQQFTKDPTSTSQRILKLMPGSAVLFSGGTRTVVNLALTSPVTLRKNGRYFIAAAVSTAAVLTIGVFAIGNSVLGTRAVTRGATDPLPPSIQSSALSSSSNSIPGVVYLSDEARLLWP